MEKPSKRQQAVLQLMAKGAALVNDTSLTQAGAFVDGVPVHRATLTGLVRRGYIRSVKYWHGNQQPFVLTAAGQAAADEHAL